MSTRDIRHPVLAPLFWAWFRARTEEDGDWLYPTGPCEVAVAGVDPIRILVIGDGPAAGYGVRIHELGIAGHLARHVARHTERGARVTVAAERAASARSTLARLDALDLDGYDAVVLMLATTDAFCLTPRRAWQRDMTALVRALDGRSAAPLFVTGTTTMHLARSLTRFARRLTGAHARVLDAETQRICLESGARMIRLDAASELGPRTYAAWARRIGAQLTSSLGSPTRSSATGR